MILKNLYMNIFKLYPTDLGKNYCKIYIMLNQHRVSSPKTSDVVLHGAPMMGHAVRTWSAIYSGARHLQFVKDQTPFVHRRIKTAETSL